MDGWSACCYCIRDTKLTPETFRPPISNRVSISADISYAIPSRARHGPSLKLQSGDANLRPSPIQPSRCRRRTKSHRLALTETDRLALPEPKLHPLNLHLRLLHFLPQRLQLLRPPHGCNVLIRRSSHSLSLHPLMRRAREAGALKQFFDIKIRDRCGIVSLERSELVRLSSLVVGSAAFRLRDFRCVDLFNFAYVCWRGHGGRWVCCNGHVVLLCDGVAALARRTGFLIWDRARCGEGGENAVPPTVFCGVLGGVGLVKERSRHFDGGVVSLCMNVALPCIDILVYVLRKM